MKKRLAMVLAVTLLAMTVFVGCGSRIIALTKVVRKNIPRRSLVTNLP